MNLRFLEKQKGQVLTEVLVAMTLFALISASIVSIVVDSLNSDIQGADLNEATSLGHQAIEIVKTIKENNWNDIASRPNNDIFGLENTGTNWIISGTENVIGRFIRYCEVQDVYRDNNGLGSIVESSSPGAGIDVNTKKLTVNVSWSNPRSNSLSFIEYLSNWESKDWRQTDWSGGSGQQIWTNPLQYLSDDGYIDNTTSGEVRLKQKMGTCNGFTWNFDNPSDYSFNPVKISVSYGLASLISSNQTYQGATLEAGFDTVNNWTSAAWHQHPNETSTNTRSSTGGNPTYWVSSNLSVRRNASVGGFWQQSFTTNVNNPDSVTIGLNYKTTTRTLQAGDTGYFYVFVENYPGEPVSVANAIWSHNISADTLNNWYSGIIIDATSKVTTAGTYYLKTGYYLKTANSGNNNQRRIVGGYDNVQLNWSKSMNGYPTDMPDIRPISSYTTPGVLSWNSFTETAIKNGGEIYYQISDDDGTTWYYWNNASWTTAGSADYNTAVEINTNIASFPAGSKKIIFKAFLQSDGTQLVQLDSVRIDCSGSNGQLYETYGELTSSAYNSAKQSNFQVLSWGEDKSTCAGLCDIRIQLRSAPDDGGIPGVWTDWYGVSGAGTDFINNIGSLIPQNLSGNYWIQYKIKISSDGDSTPVLKDINVNFNN